MSPRSRRIVGSLGLTLLLAAVGQGCEESNDDEVIIPPPIVIRSITPNSEDGPLQLSTDGDEFISITFNRPVLPNTIDVWLFPEPLSPKAFAPNPDGSGRAWTWPDIQLDAAAGAYHLIVDGLEMQWPVSYAYRVDPEREFLVGLNGLVSTPGALTPDPEGAVVFALEVDTAFNHLRPETWFDEEVAVNDVVAAVAVIDDNVAADGPIGYELSYLQTGSSYYVVAIKDTNDDLDYDPLLDWWAPYLTEGSFDPVETYDLLPDDKPEVPAISVDLVLGPPGAR